MLEQDLEEKKMSSVARQALAAMDAARKAIVSSTWSGGFSAVGMKFLRPRYPTMPDNTL